MTETTYLDFELGIETANALGSYTVAILHATGGEARAMLTLPADALLLAADLPNLSAVDAQSFGLALFDALITGAIRTSYAVSQQMAAQQGQGLRLKLRITPSELLAVPWELLYDPNEGEFVCLTRQTPLVRYLAVPQSLQSLTIQPPLRILGMVASPSDYPALDVAGEQARLSQALAPLQQAGLVELTWVAGQTWRALQQALQSGAWHVFHYIGHATFDAEQRTGALLLVDEQGATRSLTATELARLLGDQPALRLAVLNACQGAQGDEQSPFSSLAGRLVQRGLPAVIAMQAPLSDVAALEFAQSFYSAISNTLPVDAALSEARKAISLTDPASAEWATPVLYLRSPDGVLWSSTKQEEKAMANEKPKTTYHINTGGGDVIQGNVNVQGGDFVGRNKITRGDEVRGHKAGGDVVINTIGDNARNVAAGKKVTQTITEGGASATAKQVIEQQLAQVHATLTALQNKVDATKMQMADFQLKLLASELTKTEEDQTPSASTITLVGDWLLDNLPEITGAITSLFSTAAVGMVVEKAGKAAVDWMRRRIG